MPRFSMQYPQALFLFTLAVKLADIATVVAIWCLTWDLRFYSKIFPMTHGIPQFETYALISYPLAVIFCVMFHAVGAYRRDRVRFGFRASKKVCQGVVLGTLVLVAYLYFTELYRFSRLYLSLFCALSLAAVLVERFFLELIWQFLMARLLTPIKTLLIGYGDTLQVYRSEMERMSDYPIHWLGRLGPRSSENDSMGVKYLGEETELLSVIRGQPVDQVVLSYPSKDPGHYEPLLRQLSNELASVKVIPDFGKYSTFTYQAGHDFGIPLLQFNTSPLGGTDKALKRFLDILGSLGFLVLCSPLYLFIGVLVKLSSKGPVFYSQERMGADGKLFLMYKFRTMQTDAEESTGAVWAVENDTRVTYLGRFLRRTSLDEIPQFFNVLRGDMSLVGPRPERPFFVEQFRESVPKYMLRHQMRSGITGWAQINGWRGNTSIEERINHDLFYIRNWSLLLDIKILLLTFFKGFVNRNAY
ncbi:MAG: undecaprenyl-phosphate glucose phosphotransferase [Proteobacteria bacterium]|nr:undecaprenyl-phosphate glucose phosphotransferase [Pseudomonadota bacterium]NDC23172.1 undecaprenyl-phosphate glucose phosphotransferase [Pseudomonadota bacterium]NDD03383.1 undecaprenyl-phosphate glucose phosphotransferase [Pseudomonadota bacterium]NDG25613.1 undecaprenyl-phosphate glucose phosphotransferase [Pseudomonadota bacterium]